MEFLAIIQARMSSTRLPGKVLQPLNGAPLLQRMVERVSQSRLLDGCLVATSTDRSDNLIAECCRDLGITCRRGSLNDVLDRFYRAAFTRLPNHVVRLTADCPLIDPTLIDDVLRAYQRAPYGYYGNTIERSYADGLDIEVFPFANLRIAWQEATRPEEREHVTPFLWRNPQRFRPGSYLDTVNREHWRWTVDEPRDLQFVQRVFAELYDDNPAFTRHDVYRLLEQKPTLAEINAGCGQIHLHQAERTAA